MLEAITPVEIVFLSILTISFLSMMGYYFGVFSKLAFYKQSTDHNPVEQPVSVIICGRNEAKNLKKYLELVLQQDYKNFQVIVVNDCSFDDSAEFLEEMAAKYKHLKIVTIEEQEKYRHGKKFALTLGIKASQHELLLLTDADCYPASNQWLRNMQDHYVKGIDIVLGYGAYIRKKGFINKLIRFDTVYAAFQFLSFSLLGKTYMGVGRNLSYRKSRFFENKGFANHYHILSGDDDLLINEIATSTNTAVELRQDSFTYSEPETTLKGWFKQKRRHLSTSKLYKPGHKRMLGFLHLSNFLFYSSLIALLITGFSWIIILILYIVRIGIQMFIMGRGMKMLKESDLVALIPILDIFLVIFYPILAVSGLFYKKDQMEVNSNLSDKAQHDYHLVKRAVEGDQKAYAELMHRYRDSIYFMLLKMVNNRDDAEDLTIEAFGKAFKNIRQYTPDYAFSTWLFKIATNNCIDFIRRKRKNTFSIDKGFEGQDGNDNFMDLKSEGLDPEENFIKKQKAQLMHDVVDKLKPRYKRLIELRYFNELSYEEIATELGLPLGTVKAQLFRARDFLYQIIKDSQGKL